jgi:hypothetical protein
VCNFVELAARSGDPADLRSAVGLVDQVHWVLGRHREDDRRSGWISGLSEELGAQHPTAGGLRIGKRLPERAPDAPYDARLEWDRDGQYLHYLTKWMRALALMARSTDDERYLRWSIELAQRACAAFRYVGADGRRRLYWKMSVDLSRPLVPTMGHHDPLDAMLTFVELQAGAARRFPGARFEPLDVEIAGLGEIASGIDWTTTDLLGIGGLLSDAHRLLQLVVLGASTDTALIGRLLESALAGLRSLRRDSFSAPADERLAFRELGLSIGLKASARMGPTLEAEAEHLDPEGVLGSHLAELRSRAPLGERIDSFWLRAENQSARSWRAHQDINSAMLATSLAPDAYLSV